MLLLPPPPLLFCASEDMINCVCLILQSLKSCVYDVAYFIHYTCILCLEQAAPLNHNRHAHAKNVERTQIITCWYISATHRNNYNCFKAIAAAKGLRSVVLYVIIRTITSMCINVLTDISFHQFVSCDNQFLGHLILSFKSYKIHWQQLLKHKDILINNVQACR